MSRLRIYRFGVEVGIGEKPPPPEIIPLPSESQNMDDWMVSRRAQVAKARSPKAQPLRRPWRLTINFWRWSWSKKR